MNVKKDLLENELQHRLIILRLLRLPMVVGIVPIEENNREKIKKTGNINRIV